MSIQLRLITVVAMAIWGSTFVAMKVLVVDLPPMFILFWRMVFALGAFILLWKWVFKGNRYQSGDIFYFILMGLFEPCLYFMLESEALVHTSAGQAGMVTALFPIMLAVAAYWFFAERVGRFQVFGLFLGVAGVVWMTLVSEQVEMAPNPLLGNSLEALAMMSAIGYTLMVKRLSARYTPLFLTSLQAVAGIVFFGVGLMFEVPPEKVEVHHWWILVYLGVGATLGAYGLYNYVVSKVPASQVAGYINLIPVFAVGCSVVFLGEVIGLTQLMAMMLIFVGIALSGRASGKVNPVSN